MFSSLCGALAGGPAHNPHKKKSTNSTINPSIWFALFFRLFFGLVACRSRRPITHKETRRGKPKEFHCSGAPNNPQFLSFFNQLLFGLPSRRPSTSKLIHSSHSKEKNEINFAVLNGPAVVHSCPMLK